MRRRYKPELETLTERMFIEQEIYFTKMDMRKAKRQQMEELQTRLDSLYDKLIQAIENEYIVVSKATKK